jgi:hypothetical protein
VIYIESTSGKSDRCYNLNWRNASLYNRAFCRHFLGKADPATYITSASLSNPGRAVNVRNMLNAGSDMRSFLEWNTCEYVYNARYPSYIDSFATLVGSWFFCSDCYSQRGRTDCKILSDIGGDTWVRDPQERIFINRDNYRHLSVPASAYGTNVLRTYPEFDKGLFKACGCEPEFSGLRCFDPSSPKQKCDWYFFFYSCPDYCSICQGTVTWDKCLRWNYLGRRVIYPKPLFFADQLQEGRNVEAGEKVRAAREWLQYRRNSCNYNHCSGQKTCDISGCVVMFT